MSRWESLWDSFSFSDPLINAFHKFWDIFSQSFLQIFVLSFSFSSLPLGFSMTHRIGMLGGDTQSQRICLMCLQLFFCFSDWINSIDPFSSSLNLSSCWICCGEHLMNISCGWLYIINSRIFIWYFLIDLIFLSVFPLCWIIVNILSVGSLKCFLRLFHNS